MNAFLDNAIILYFCQVKSQTLCIRMNEITLGRTARRTTFGGDCLKNNGKERACPWRNCNLGRNDCLKLDGKESRELGDREMSTISATGILRPMHEAQSGCFCSANIQL